MVEEQTAQIATTPKVRFIPDIPADDDFFSTHTRVAQAIVSAIEENSEIKVIGLLGRWGSGKSTVANKVVELLEAPEESGFKVFPYDAWLHQSDPLRRSFLESLIVSLVRTGAISRGKWTKKLRKLSRPVEDTRTIETPVLSSDARWIALSLLAATVGLGFLGFDTLKEAFGDKPSMLGVWTVRVSASLVLLPVFTWIALYLKQRPWKRLLDAEEGVRGKKFWQVLDKEGEPTKVIHLFVEGQAKHTSTRTFRSNEPTSLEFGRMFQKIMREVDKRGHRLVILIDNLDRVAEEEALGMWATIRSFFLASHETEDATHERFHPTVILPIDRHAVEELFAGSDEQGHKGGRDRARSFMDKTFDVTFEVTEPVKSDWREFLAQQMKWMFGDAYQPSWSFWTRRLFESQLARQQIEAASEEGRPRAIVTPREINKLLNRVGALYLQWVGAGIPVEVMALYVIRRDDIDNGILAFLQSTDIEIAEVAPQWKGQLAALHYGVDPEKAAQVLLEEPIRTAIARRDHPGLKALAHIPGFGEIFEYATANLPEPATSNTPFDILTNAILLLQSLGSGGDEWSNNAWRNLVSKYGETAADATPSPGAVEILKLLSGHVTPEGSEDFIEISAGLLSRLMARSRKTTSDGAALRAGAENLIEFATAHDLPAPLFELEIDPQVFVTRLSEFSSSSRVWRLLRTHHDGDALGAALSDMLGTEIVQRNVPSALRCFTLPDGADLYSGDTEIDFESVGTKAGQLVRDPGSFGGDAMSGIRVLADLSYGQHTEGKEVLAALVDEGVLAVRFNDAVERSDWAAAAVIVAILLWRGKKFDPPSSFNWYQYPDRDPDHLKNIVVALRWYFPGNLVSILWAAQKASYTQSSFVETIIGYAVESDSLGKFDTAQVFANLYEYKQAVPYRLRDRFLELVNRQSNFLEALQEAPLGPQTVEVVSYLRRKGGEDADRADAFMRTRVEQADAAAWSVAIQSGQELYGIGQAFIKSGDLKFGRKSGLYDALHGTIPAMVKNGGREMRGRWFKLIDLMQPKHGKALLRALGDATGDAPPAQALQVLKTGGVQFLKTGGFASRADRSVRTIILRQLDKKDGRDWLKDNKDELTVWVQRADSKVRDELMSSLSGMLASKRDDRRYTADILAAKWGLKPSV